MSSEDTSADERARARHGHDRRAHRPGAKERADGGDGAGGGDRDPGLLLRGAPRMRSDKRTLEKPIPISPLIALDRERCILCYRCTRFSESVSEDGQLVAVNRGRSTMIATFEDEPYRAHFSGNV